MWNNCFSNTAQRVISLNGVIIDKNLNYVKTWMYLFNIQYDFICMPQLSMGSSAFSDRQTHPSRSMEKRWDLSCRSCLQWPCILDKERFNPANISVKWEMGTETKLWAKIRNYWSIVQTIVAMPQLQYRRFLSFLIPLETGELSSWILPYPDMARTRSSFAGSLRSSFLINSAISRYPHSSNIDEYPLHHFGQDLG